MFWKFQFCNFPVHSVDLIPASQLNQRSEHCSSFAAFASHSTSLISLSATYSKMMETLQFLYRHVFDKRVHFASLVVSLYEDMVTESIDESPFSTTHCWLTPPYTRNLANICIILISAETRFHYEHFCH